MDDVPRPVSAPSLIRRVRDWIEWFGLARLVTSAVAVVIVCVGAWWLVRAPVPPSESSLPMASPPSSASPSAPDAVGAGSTLAPVASGASPAVDAPSGSAVAGAATGGDVLTVHVAGAVRRAGVYQLSVGSRVEAAIEQAGGVTSDADPDALNLAAPLVDGTRVYVPTVGEVPPPALEPPAASAASAPSGPVDVNRASAIELDSLPGVGPATASAIVVERERNGPFASVDDLERVPGIGPAKLEALRDLVST